MGKTVSFLDLRIHIFRHKVPRLLPLLSQFALTMIKLGGDLQDKSQLFDGSQVNSIVTPIYKNREKIIFEFEVRLDPPHSPSKFENHHVRVKNQNCRRPIE